jgi:hypothetical protein
MREKHRMLTENMNMHMEANLDWEPRQDLCAVS